MVMVGEDWEREGGGGRGADSESIAYSKQWNNAAVH